jgi:ketosteroid isomerase-like protein
MSQENVEIVRATFDAWNAGRMDVVREFYDPDIVVRTGENWLEPGPFVGREAVMRQFNQLRETFESDSLELVSDFVDIGDRVAVRWEWRPSGRGPQISPAWTTVYTVRNGKILDIHYFEDHAEALGAIGLKE